jgi:hypothetical protein
MEVIVFVTRSRVSTEPLPWRSLKIESSRWMTVPLEKMPGAATTTATTAKARAPRNSAERRRRVAERGVSSLNRNHSVTTSRPTSRPTHRARVSWTTVLTLSRIATGAATSRTAVRRASRQAATLNAVPAVTRSVMLAYTRVTPDSASV